jgi:hypothetical protein
VPCPGRRRSRSSLVPAGASGSGVPARPATSQSSFGAARHSNVSAAACQGDEYVPVRSSGVEQCSDRSPERSRRRATAQKTRPEERSRALRSEPNRQGVCGGALIVGDGGHPLPGSTVGQFPGAGLAHEPADTAGLSFE